MDRRQVLFSSVLAGMAGLRCAAPRGHKERAPRPLRVLVLGGTNFVGPAIVARGLEAGHSVTLFNRGITRPHLFGDVEKLQGDRRQGMDGLAALARSRTWDAVIDVWATDDALVQDAVRLLAGRADYYFYISSIAAYRSFARPGVREDAPLRVEEEGYGGEKARAEEAIGKAFAGRFGVARCPPIFGPLDPGASLHYWLRVFARRPQVLAPIAEGSAIQLIDVRDVARWTIDAVEARRVGVYNVMTDPMPFRAFLSAVRTAVASQAEVAWADDSFLRNQRVEAFSDLPLWIPAQEDPGFFRISNGKAKQAGLQVRPIEATLAAAWRWYQSAFFGDRTFPSQGMGMTEERHDALLAAWASRTN